MKGDEFGLEEKLGNVFELLLGLILFNLEKVEVLVISLIDFMFVVGFFLLKFNEGSVYIDFMVFLYFFFIEGVCMKNQEQFQVQKFVDVSILEGVDEFVECILNFIIRCEELNFVILEVKVFMNGVVVLEFGGCSIVEVFLGYVDSSLLIMLVENQDLDG